MPTREESPPFESLARSLRVIASSTRLQILHALRTRHALHEIRAAPTLSREEENPARPLSRQTISHHLEQLLEARLVHRSPGGEVARGDLYVVNHERLFALVDEIRGLARLTPAPAAAADAAVTASVLAPHSPSLPPPPRLLLAYGRDDGVSFPLPREPGASAVIGRAPECDVRLDYDPYLSSRHAAIEAGADGFALRDLGSRNGTAVNWSSVPREGTRPLASGDLITAGRSLLVFQS